MSAANPIYVRVRDLMEAELGDELVALDVEDGLCFGFNAVATDVWRLLERPHDVAGLVDALTAEYDVGPAECSQDVRDVLAVLEQHRLVERS